MTTGSWRLLICVPVVFLHRQGVLVVLASISRVEIQQTDGLGQHVPV